MVHLTKAQRDELKARGEWISKKLHPEGDRPNDRSKVKEFVRLAEEANRIEPFYGGYKPVFDSTKYILAPPSDGFSGFIEQTSGLNGYPIVFQEEYPGVDDPKANFHANMSIAIGNRLLEVSQTDLHTGVPDLSAKLPLDAYHMTAVIGDVLGDGYQAHYASVDSCYKALVWQALQMLKGCGVDETHARFWLPTSSYDLRTNYIIQGKFREKFGWFDHDDIAPYMFTGVIPHAALRIINHYAQDHMANLLLAMFRQYKDGPAFHATMTKPALMRALNEIGLRWDQPDPGQLCFHLDVKDVVHLYKNIDPFQGQEGTYTLEDGRHVLSDWGATAQLARISPSGHCEIPPFFQDNEALIVRQMLNLNTYVFGPAYISVGSPMYIGTKGVDLHSLIEWDSLLYHE